VRGITYNPVTVKKEALKVDAALLTMTKQELPDDNRPMIEAEELEAGEVVLKEEDEDDDAMLNTIENVILVTEAEEKAAAESEDLNVGMSSEQTFSTGMVLTLNILRQQGLLVSTSRALFAAPQPQTLKVTDYLVGHQLDDALAAGQDLVISWPFADGQISDFMQAKAFWYIYIPIPTVSTDDLQILRHLYALVTSHDRHEPVPSPISLLCSG
jgi:hypothetical protein